MATAPHTRGGTRTQPRPAAAADTSRKKATTQRAASATATAPLASRGARQAAFLQLTATIDEEVAEQQQRIDRIFADISGRCEKQLGKAAAASSGADGPRAAAPASASADGERNQPTDSTTAAAPSTAFHVPAQPFHFTTAAAVPAVHSALQSSVAQLHSAVEHISQKEQQRPPIPTFQLRSAALADPVPAALAAAPALAARPPPFVTAQLNLHVEEATPSPSPQPPHAHPLPSVPPSAHRPATPLRASMECGIACAVQFGSASGQIDVPVQPVMHSLPMQQGEQKDGLSAATPRSAAMPALASFPALQRAADVRAAAMQPPPAGALDPFPSLSRALQMRQERLRTQANSQQQLSTAAHSTAATPSSSATARPLFSDAIHPTPIAAVPAASAGAALSAASSVSQPSNSAVLSPAEADRLSVALLLKQQSLSLLCTQFQSRVGRLTRHRFLLTWRWRLRLLRMARAIERIQCRAVMRVWQWRSREWVQRRQEAATRIQSVVRRRLVQREFTPLQLSVHHHRRALVARVFSLWLARYSRVRRWRHRWTSKLSVWGSALLLHRAWGSASAFPARQWRSAEGTMRMAEEWAVWRRTRKVWGAWIQFMARKRTEDGQAAAAKGATKLGRIQRH